MLFWLFISVRMVHQFRTYENKKRLGHNRFFVIYTISLSQTAWINIHICNNNQRSCVQGAHTFFMSSSKSRLSQLRKGAIFENVHEVYMTNLIVHVIQDHRGQLAVLFSSRIPQSYLPRLHLQSACQPSDSSNEFVCVIKCLVQHVAHCFVCAIVEGL